MIDDDAVSPKRPKHEVGQDLSPLSLEEIEQRIALLHAEIERLKEAHGRKKATQAAADALFKR